MVEPVSASIGYYNADAGGEGTIGDKSVNKRGAVQQLAMPIWDARICGLSPTLDTHGFRLVPLHSKVQDWHDDTEVKRVFYPEAMALAKQLTGAKHTFSFEHLVRTENTKDFARAYARFAHCDFSDGMRTAASKIMMKRGLSSSEAADMDFCLYNIWIPIERPCLQNPLCLLDCTTTRDEDVVAMTFADSNYHADMKTRPTINQIKYSNLHRWYYFKDMQVGEAIVFKQMDGRLRSFPASVQCFHTSFEDKGLILPNYEGRRSVEIRVLCCFPKSTASKL